MSGYTPDEKLRLDQLRTLRRRWLKDQELSPREPVLPPAKKGPVERFWGNFLQEKNLWRIYVGNQESVCLLTTQGKTPTVVTIELEWELRFSAANSLK